MYLRICSLIILCLTGIVSSLAASLGDVASMIHSGLLDEASALLDSIGVKSPKNAEVDFLRGQLLEARGDDASAVTSYQEALRKGSNDARLQIAELATRRYELDEAESQLEAYRSYISKNRKKKLSDESGDLDQHITRLRNMLDRVEAIEVVDSIIVDADEFFSYYRLSPESGRLLSADQMPDHIDADDRSAIFLTEDSRRRIWAALNDEDRLVLRQSYALTDGEWSEPEEVNDQLVENGDASFPFLMPDGVTLYFAGDGDSSIGGYDIYITRNNGARWLDPQNVGFPYNSPYDDYMLAIDEVTGIGWWATDRNRIPGCVTIYLFIPSQMRINVDADDPHLASRARLDAIADTWRSDRDYSVMLAGLPQVSDKADDKADEFTFSFPDGSVITRYSQLSTYTARQAMERYVAMTQRIADDNDRLAGLREAYRAGNADQVAILRLEQQLLNDRDTLLRLSNEVVKSAGYAK